MKFTIKIQISPWSTNFGAEVRLPPTLVLIYIPTQILHVKIKMNLQAKFNRFDFIQKNWEVYKFISINNFNKDNVTFLKKMTQRKSYFNKTM